MRGKQSLALGVFLVGGLYAGTTTDDREHHHGTPLDAVIDEYVTDACGYVYANVFEEALLHGGFIRRPQPHLTDCVETEYGFLPIMNDGGYTPDFSLQKGAKHDDLYKRQIDIKAYCTYVEFMVETFTAPHVLKTVNQWVGERYPGYTVGLADDGVNPQYQHELLISTEFYGDYTRLQFERQLEIRNASSVRKVYLPPYDMVLPLAHFATALQQVVDAEHRGEDVPLTSHEVIMHHEYRGALTLHTFIHRSKIFRFATR